MSVNTRHGRTPAVVAPPPIAIASPSAVRRPGLHAIVDWLETQALFVALVAVAVILCLSGAPAHLVQDGYLALVDGRLVALHGIPHVNNLTVMAHGARWVDQQWLAQLGMYGLQRLGGYALLVVVDVVLVAAALAMAIAAAHQLGASERQVIRVLPLGALFYIVVAVSIRTQVFAYPLFVATLWLLAAEVRQPTRRRAFLVFPILLLWANLHGSVTMGVGITGLYGLTLLVHEARARHPRGVARALAFIIAPPLCLLATPYGTGVVHYYRTTLFNSEFSKLVSEWKPITSLPLLAVPFFALIALAAWLLYRSGRRTPLFHWLVLAVLAVGGVTAIRNIVWFGLACVILLPATFAARGRYADPMPKRRNLNLAIAGSMLAIAAITLIATFAHPASWFQSTYDARGVTVAERILARDPQAKIFTDVQYGDWLLWQDPRLAGHIAYDTSFELLPTRDLEAFTALSHGHLAGAVGVLAPYSVLVLDPINTREYHALLARPGVHVVLRSKRIIVATQPAT